MAPKLNIAPKTAIAIISLLILFLSVSVMTLNGASLVVLTSITEEDVERGFIDIEYIATPSSGAYITEVYFTRSTGRTNQYIFLSGTLPDHFDSMGVLGEGRIPILEGGFDLILVARDSAGYEAMYIVEDIPYVPWRTLYFSPAAIPMQTQQEGMPDGYEFTANRLSFSLQRNFRSDRVPEDILQEMLKFSNGRVINRRLSNYYIEFAIPRTEPDLRAFGELIVTNYNQFFSRYHVSLGGPARWDAMIDHLNPGSPWEPEPLTIVIAVISGIMILLLFVRYRLNRVRVK